MENKIYFRQYYQQIFDNKKIELLTKGYNKIEADNLALNFTLKTYRITKRIPTYKKISKEYFSNYIRNIDS